MRISNRCVCPGAGQSRMQHVRCDGCVFSQCLHGGGLATRWASEPSRRDSHLSIRTVHLSLCQVTASGATRFLTCHVSIEEEDEEAAKEALMSRHPGCLGTEKALLL